MHFIYTISYIHVIMWDVLIPFHTGCIPCKTHAGGSPVGPQMSADLLCWHTPKVYIFKEPCAEICISLRQFTKEYSIGYIHTVTPTGKLTPRRRSSGRVQKKSNLPPAPTSIRITFLVMQHQYEISHVVPPFFPCQSEWNQCTVCK